MARPATISSRASGHCSLCGRFDKGRDVEVHYGAVRRGVNPRTLEEHYEVWGVLEEFVCLRCERLSLARELLIRTRFSLGVAGGAVVGELATAAARGRPLMITSHWSQLLIVALMVTLMMLPASRSSWKKRHLVAQQILDRRKPQLATQLDRIPGEIVFYSPELVERLGGARVGEAFGEGVSYAGRTGAG